MQINGPADLSQKIQKEDDNMTCSTKCKSQIDLSKELRPWTLYQNISCQRTNSVNSISVLLCLNDSNNLFSEYARKYDIYEPANIGNLVLTI
jgi:hypothetical protein